jgi:serine/threonine protein kinase
MVRLVMRLCAKGSLEAFLLLSREKGGLPLRTVLDIAKQVVAGLMHLHLLGIVHRDGRAANVLLAAVDPILALLADLGVSHRLSAFQEGAPLEAASTALASKLVGAEVAGPFLWAAPEVVAGTFEGTTVTFATDVYIFGGLLHEMLTAGVVPFFWLSDAVSFPLLRRRRQSATPVEVPAPGGAVTVWPGLRGKSTLEAAALDRVPIPWAVDVSASPGSAGRLEETKVLMSQCLLSDPVARIKLSVLGRQLGDLLAREVAEEEEQRKRVAHDRLGYATLPVTVAGTPSLDAAVVVTAASLMSAMRSLGIAEELYETAAGVVLDEHNNRYRVLLQLPCE